VIQMKKGIVVLALRTVATALLLSLLSCASHMSTSSISEPRLTGILSRIDPWPPSSTIYSDAAWQELIDAAKVIQMSSPESVKEAMREYQRNQTGSDQEINDDGKLYLLLRVVFEIPEKVPVSGKREVFGGWVTMRTELNDDGTENLAWPVSWQNGRPCLVSGYHGLQGFEARYQAAEEYDYFRNKYRMRNL
jgi:hypothetical protein